MSDFRTTFWDRELLPTKTYPSHTEEYPAVPSRTWNLLDGRTFTTEAREAFTRVVPPMTRYPASALETKRVTRYSGRSAFRWTWMGVRCVVQVTFKRRRYQPLPPNPPAAWVKWSKTHKVYLDPVQVDVYLGRNGNGPLVMTRRKMFRLPR